ncbi:unannotated protein [freshwater metagenome]|uniref:Unannotated protein n=1 Tax=freshwater metagenome TaxID=449393 RepID=A0A6J5ZM74_9ZZZZ|nr:hypothetical protein [Actinomycetota bacterium]MSW25311.1 hypothetical protein [Actinomycetota bacterium]MSX29868.1 hypothetical protein [Actinomycetota bacterium]MSX43289.1 hypothetical protein [Actinomycetota bacterium]MSX96922.1 hypothetical protein [Actinomycetota bacterium]
MTSSRTRPLPITGIAVLSAVASTFYFVIGVVLVLNPKFDAIGGNSAAALSTPSPFELIAGICCITMGFVYIWIIRELLAKSQIAYVLIQTIVIINILFSLFRLPLGLITLTMNLAVLYFLRTKSSKTWLSGE